MIRNVKLCVPRSSMRLCDKSMPCSELLEFDMMAILSLLAKSLMQDKKIIRAHELNIRKQRSCGAQVPFKASIVNIDLFECGRLLEYGQQTFRALV